MKIKLFCKLTLIVTLISCSSSNELPPGKRAGGFSLADPMKHKIALKLMQERKIPYEINDRGHVIYLVKDKAEVLGIIRKAQYGDILDETIFEVLLVNDQLSQNKYEAAFKKEGIPYNIFEHKGLMQIKWSQKYGPKVDKLRQNIDEEIMDTVIKESKSMEPDLIN